MACLTRPVVGLCINRWAGEGAGAPRVIVARVERFGASTLNDCLPGERWPG